MNDFTPTQSTPNAGDYVIFGESGGYSVRRVAKVTPKLIKFDGNMWPRQIERSKAVAFTPDEAKAALLKQTLDGIAGERNRRERAARQEYVARCAAAREAANKQIVVLLSSGIFAASVDRSGAAGETALAGSTEGESAVGSEADETPIQPLVSGHPS